MDFRRAWRRTALGLIVILCLAVAALSFSQSWMRTSTLLGQVSNGIPCANFNGQIAYKYSPCVKDCMAVDKTASWRYIECPESTNPKISFECIQRDYPIGGGTCEVGCTITKDDGTTGYPEEHDCCEAQSSRGSNDNGLGESCDSEPEKVHPCYVCSGQTDYATPPQCSTESMADTCAQCGNLAGAFGMLSAHDAKKALKDDPGLLAACACDPNQQDTLAYCQPLRADDGTKITDSSGKVVYLLAADLTCKDGACAVPSSSTSSSSKKSSSSASSVSSTSSTSASSASSASSAGSTSSSGGGAPPPPTTPTTPSAPSPSPSGPTTPSPS